MIVLRLDVYLCTVTAGRLFGGDRMFGYRYLHRRLRYRFDYGSNQTDSVDCLDVTYPDTDSTFVLVI